MVPYSAAVSTGELTPVDLAEANADGIAHLRWPYFDRLRDPR